MTDETIPNPGPADPLTRALLTTSDAAARSVLLPPVEQVRRRGDQRRRRRSAGQALAALVVVGGLATGLHGLDGGTPVAPATPAPPTTSTTTPQLPVTEENLVDGSRQVDILVPDQGQLSAEVEGALIVTDNPGRDAGGVASTWVVRPTTDGNVQLVGVGAEADGRDMCANVVDEETVGFEICDPSSPSQVFALRSGLSERLVPSADGSDVVTGATFRSASGYLVATDGGLRTTLDEASATQFTLQDVAPAS